jgi:4-amino-4-deoxy-L-arabinose transferase-like glycosyltransferase
MENVVHHGRIKMKKGKKTLNSQFSIFNSRLSMILMLILAGVPFAIGRYLEFNYPDPFDSASNVYSAKHILDGARIGIEEIPSAALGTLLVNILGVRLFGFSEFGPKLIQSIMQAGALVAMFAAMRKLFGKLPAVVGVIVASVYLSSPLIAKFGNVKEQYMIACMMTATSLFVLRQLGGGWWCSLLAGAIAAWAPLFKETGTSVIGAIGLFVIVQPIFRHRTWKQTGIDIMLLLSGAAAAMAPLCIWIIGWKVQMSLPYSFVWGTIAGFLPRPEASQQASNYVSSIRETLPFSEQWPRVLRYYLALCLPVSLALGSIVVRIAKLIVNLAQKSPAAVKSGYDRFVLLLGVWWALDMAFVWISPASYEQYYLPLTASGAMTGGYLIAVYRDKLAGAVFKTKWVVTGIVGFILMVVMSWHIFLGLPRSPYSGTKYPEKRNGYAQRWAEISNRKKQGWRGAWEAAGEYIRNHTQPTDKIYVWGWVPGIYLSAQRFSSSPNAFESEMHTRPPEQLAQIIDELIGAFDREMPQYIVDSRKRHLPLDRPQLELWPILSYSSQGKPQFLPTDPQMVAEFERQWKAMLQKRFGDDEARRFEVMGKFRRFVMGNYERVEPMFGDCVVFKLKTSHSDKQ